MGIAIVVGLVVDGTWFLWLCWPKERERVSVDRGRWWRDGGGGSDCWGCCCCCCWLDDGWKKMRFREWLSDSDRV